MAKNRYELLFQALWHVYRRADQPLPWSDGADFPWEDATFSKRALVEHLDESHGAASRTSAERSLQVDWLWQKLGLRLDYHILDLTCGPGFYAVELARRGCRVTGIDINPASIDYANQLAASQEVSERCTFIELDIRRMEAYAARFDAAIFLYEQLAVFTRVEALNLLARISQALKSGGKLCVELLNQDHVDKRDDTWWFTDDTGLWGDEPFLQLGERIWNEEDQSSIEQYHIINLESGALKEFAIFDQTYAVETMVSMMKQAGFADVRTYSDWDGLALYDASEWVIYVATKA